MKGIFGDEVGETLGNAFDNKDYSGALEGIGTFQPTARIPPLPADFCAKQFAQKHASDLNSYLTPLGCFFLVDSAAPEQREATSKSLELLCSAAQMARGTPTLHDAKVLLASFPQKLGELEKLVGSTDEGYDASAVVTEVEKALGAERVKLQPVLDAFKTGAEFEKFLNAKWYSLQDVGYANMKAFRSIGRGGFGTVFGGLVHELARATQKASRSDKYYLLANWINFLAGT